MTPFYSDATFILSKILKGLIMLVTIMIKRFLFLSLCLIITLSYQSKAYAQIFGKSPRSKIFDLIGEKNLEKLDQLLQDKKLKEKDFNYQNKNGETFLTYAYKLDQFEVVTKLIDYGLSPFTANIQGTTLLHLIIAKKNKQHLKEVVQQLVKNDIDVVSLINQNPSLFYQAIVKNNNDAVKIFIDLGVNPCTKISIQSANKNQKEHSSFISLMIENYQYDHLEYLFKKFDKLPHDCLSEKDLSLLSYVSSVHQKKKLIKHLHRHYPDSQRMDGLVHQTALQIAFENKDLEKVRDLLKSFQIKNMEFINKSTPLIMALENDWDDIVKDLIQKGVNPNQIGRAASKKSEKMLPLGLALLKNNTELVVELVKAGASADQFIFSDGSTPLQQAIENNNIDQVKILLDAGVNINQLSFNKKYQRKMHPLEYLLQEKNFELAQFLLQNGAKLGNANFHNGKSPLSIALENNQAELLKLLLKSGLSPDQRFIDETGDVNTPLVYAFNNNLFSLAKILVHYDASLNLVFQSGNNFLTWAIRQNQPDLVEALMKKGLSPNTVPKLNGKVVYPLLEAIKLNNPQMLDLLFKYKINAQQFNFEGNLTPLMGVINQGKKDLVEVFLQHGADMHEKNIHGESAYSLAMKGRFEGVKNLLKYYQLKDQEAFEEAFALILSVNNEESLNNLLKGDHSFKVELPYLVRDHLVMLIDQAKSPLVLSAIKEYLDNEGVKIDEKVLPLMQEKTQKIHLKYLDKIVFNKGKICQSKQNKNLENLIEVNKVDSAPSDEEVKTCKVCFSDIEKGEKSYQGPADCSCHLCQDCFGQFLNVEVKNKGSDLSYCPGCSGEVTANFLQKSDVEKETIEKFRKRILANKLALLPGWSFCPTPDCFNGKLLSSQDASISVSPFFSCTLCMKDHCLKCAKNHKGPCDQFEQQSDDLKNLLSEGRLAPPKNGHPNDPNHPDFLKGRYRPCYYCGTITERPLDGTSNNGQCNSMVCARPQCGKKWHFTYGDHGLHPYNLEHHSQSEMHDFKREEQKYEPLVAPHF